MPGRSVGREHTPGQQLTLSTLQEHPQVARHTVAESMADREVDKRNGLSGSGGTGGMYIQPATGTGSLTALAGIFQGCTYTPKGGVPGWLPWYPASAYWSPSPWCRG